jgi:hypothetical protein
MTNILEEKQKNRWLMLRKVYEITEGISGTRFVNMYEVGKELGWDRPRTESVLDYLEGEGLLKSKYIGGGIVITHQGVMEVEEAEQNPDKKTLHFPPNIINNIYGDNIGGDKVMGDKIGTQVNNYPYVMQTAQDIKALLDGLSADHPDDSSRVIAAKAIDNADLNPELKSRMINVLKAGSFAALEKMIDHPVAKFFIAGAKEAFK